MKKIFLIGEKGIGKSRVINQVLKNFSGIPQYGFYTKAEENLIYLYPGKILVGEKGKGGIISAFNQEGSKIIGQAKGDGIILLDELGWMEEEAEFFNDSIRALLEKDYLILGVLRTNPTSKLNQEILKRKDVRIYTVTKDNRDELPGMIQKEIEREMMKQ